MKRKRVYLDIEVRQTYSIIILWLAPHKADPIMNMISDAMRDHFRVSMSLNLAHMIMKPVYVIRYAMTTQPVLLKPWRSLVIVTNAVLTIETSRLGRKIAIKILFNQFFMS